MFGLRRVHGYMTRISVSRHKTLKAEKKIRTQLSQADKH